MQDNVNSIDMLLVKARVAELQYLPLIQKGVGNWYEVMLFRLGLMKSITIKFRSGKQISIADKAKFIEFWNSEEAHVELFKSVSPSSSLSFTDDLIQFNYNGKTLRFYYDRNASYEPFSVLREVFVDKKYDPLEVSDRDVVDVGAFIGETAIFFALKGAKHVYAFESDKKSYELSQRNIVENGLQDKITLVNMMVGPDWNGFERVLNSYSVGNAAFKIDCDGCEYALILERKAGEFGRFDVVQMEYHKGYLDLEKKLVGMGYQVRHTIPNSFAPGRFFGHVFASKKR